VKTLPIARLASLALLGTVLLTACGPDAERPSVGPSAGEPVGPTAEQCARVLSDQTLETLGWEAGQDATAATADTGRCERQAGGSGILTAGIRPVPDAGGARDAYDEKCAALAGTHGDVMPAVDWLAAEGTACGRLPVAGEDVGVAEVFLLTGDDRLLQVRLAVLRPTERSRLEAAMDRMVSAAVADL